MPAEIAKLNPGSVSIDQLIFPDPDNFKAGGLHNNVTEWQNILINSPDSTMILNWLKYGVNIFNFFQHFKGSYGPISYDDSVPPSNLFPNSESCGKFQDFIAKEVSNRLNTGAISVWGKIDEVNPPYIVSPITVEPTKPRMCLNMRYLNLWMKDTPFKLDTLNVVPRIVSSESFLTKLDDKSGYDHVLVSELSRPFFGFQWDGVFYACNTIPFGWKNSAYVYHTLSVNVASYLRQLQVNNIVYIDDRLIEQVSISNMSPKRQAEIAIYMVCQVVVRLGYCIGLTKSELSPVNCIIYLGMWVDACNQTFRLTESKKSKFCYLREEILSHKEVNLLSLQRFSGKCMSFVLAIPGAKLFVSECFRCISLIGQSGCDKIRISQELRNELEFWRFLDNWNGSHPWKPEYHCTLNLSSDSSDYGWGAKFTFKGGSSVIHDYWDASILDAPIAVKEAKALYLAVKGLKDKVKNCRLDVCVDNKVLIYCWNNQMCRSPILTNVLKDLFFLTLEYNIYINLIYVLSACNEADAPSRTLSKSDACISHMTFKRVEQFFGPHTLDLMALDSNCMTGLDGSPLKHYTPFETPLSDGVNVFAQIITDDENPYVFPPFNLIPSILNLLEEQSIDCTVVVPALSPIPAWFPKLARFCQEAHLLAYKGDKSVLLYPSKSGFKPDKLGLPWNLWVVRFTPQPKGNVANLKLFVCPPSSHFPFVVIGDSIVSSLREFVKEGKLLCIPGAKISDIIHNLRCMSKFITCNILIVHVGINDINKPLNEFHQLTVCIKSLMGLISVLIRCFKETTFIFSEILYTEKKDIRARCDVGK
ncbi:hypothetical protein SNE40_022182 [Patella caerulea]|uniref:Reverse transcriptase domain-containing protein n=1 Tax=Patella caerulea TaxID=87958 RepID=A0AAN8IYU1_PATCE